MRSGAPKVEFSEHTALRNHAALTAKVRDGIATALGAAQVVEIAPAMVAEDFGRLRGQGVPLCMFRLVRSRPRASRGSARQARCPVYTAAATT